MNILEVGLAQAIRLIRVGPDDGQTVYGVNLSRAFESRYGFLEGPRKVADFNYQTGVTFLHGYFEGVVIERAQVFHNGLLVETKKDTATSERAILDMMEWGRKEAGLKFGEPESIRIYNSTLVVQLGPNFAKSLDVFKKPAALLSKMLTGYDVPVSKAETTGFSLGVDVSGSGPNPLRIERRTGVSFAENTFFSSAPLSTEDHIQMLEFFES